MLNSEESRILDWIDRHAEEVVTILQTMIRWPTVTPELDMGPDAAAFRDHQAWVEDFLRQLGMATTSWEIDSAELPENPGWGVLRDRSLAGMPVVTGEWHGRGGRSLILNGHYDVVPAGDADLWSFPPFSGTVSGGRVFGRGAVDMKGGNAAMLFALKAIIGAGVEPAGNLTVQIVPDEEASCMGTLACCLEGMRADAALIPEPTDMSILVAMRGSVYGTIRVRGRAGHAEMVQPHWTEGGAVNAIHKAAGVVRALEDLSERWQGDPSRWHPLIGPDHIAPTVIQGGDWDVTIPDLVEIRFGAQFSPGSPFPLDEIREAVRKEAEADSWLAENLPEIHVKPWIYGAEVGREEPIVRLAETVLSSIGVSPSLRGFGSLTDAVHLVNLAQVPTISIGPGTETMHAVNENIAIDELVRLSKAIALLILRWTDKTTRTGEKV